MFLSEPRLHDLFVQNGGAEWVLVGLKPLKEPGSEAGLFASTNMWKTAHGQCLYCWSITPQKVDSKSIFKN